MAQFSIAEAKNHLPRLVQAAEAGDTVRITRRGRPVAVLVSEGEYARLTGTQSDLKDFLSEWRRAVDASGAEYTEPEELTATRDQAVRSPVTFE